MFSTFLSWFTHLQWPIATGKGMSMQGSINETVDANGEREHPLKPRFFALVIGIDEYYQRGPDPPKHLMGCVNDSNDFYNFLIGNLGVPKKHIKVLQNKKATKKAILDTFDTHFIHNEAIRTNDAIIFYFAGHGGRHFAPSLVTEEKQVETLCPFDVCSERGISGIPDYEMANKLRELAEKKGNNIVAIFDSCYSGGMAREGENERIRCYDPGNGLGPLPQAADLPVRGGISASMNAPGESFVLLAACKAEEWAREAKAQSGNRWSGAFTKALIASLTSWAAAAASTNDSESLTYTRLIESLELKNQNPHCEGKNRVRRLFSPSYEGADDFSVEPAKEKGLEGYYWVAAGSIHGVIKGTEFTSKPSGGHSSIRLTVERVEEHRALAKPDPLVEGLIPPPDFKFRATVSKWKTKWLKVVLNPLTAFPNVIETEDTLFTLAENQGLFTLKVSSDGDQGVRLERASHPLFKHVDSDSDPRLSPPLSQITTDFLNKVAHFNFFLHSGYPSSHSLTVSVSLHRVELRRPGDNTYFPVTRGSDGPVNLFQSLKSADISTSHEAILQASNDSYGLTIRNLSDVELFVYVFFLDPFEYTISRIYIPASEKNYSLKRKGENGSELAIGYGKPYERPWCFTDVPKGLDEDSGFLKIFVSTAYINIEALETMPGPGRLTMIPKDQLVNWSSWTDIITVKRELENGSVVASSH